MAAFKVLFVLFASLLSRISGMGHSGYDVAVRTNNAPGTSDADTHLAIRRAMTALQEREDDDGPLKWNETLTRSWDGATLLLLVQTPYMLPLDCC